MEEPTFFDGWEEQAEDWAIARIQQVLKTEYYRVSEILVTERMGEIEAKFHAHGIDEYLTQALQNRVDNLDGQEKADFYFHLNGEADE